MLGNGQMSPVRFDPNSFIIYVTSTLVLLIASEGRTRHRGVEVDASPVKVI